MSVVGRERELPTGLLISQGIFSDPDRLNILPRFEVSIRQQKIDSTTVLVDLVSTFIAVSCLFGQNISEKPTAFPDAP